MVRRVRRGYSQRHVARTMNVCRSEAQYWLRRTAGQRLDRVDWANRPAGAKLVANRSTSAQETLVVELRERLRQSPLGECGAAAIAQAWPPGPVLAPSVRTIGRILARRGLLDGQRRLRHMPPPRGWYLPDAANGQAELDSFDAVEGLVIAGVGEVEVLNAISLHGGPVDSWPMRAVNTDAGSARDCPATPNSTTTPAFKAPSSTCAAATPTVPSRCWATVGTCTPSDRIAWFALRWICATNKSAFTPCAAELRVNNGCCAKNLASFPQRHSEPDRLLLSLGHVNVIF